MIKNFRTYNLSVKFYHESENLKLSGALKNQFDRASSSISLNLAEGWGKSSKKDRLRFFQIAFGSLRECQSILQLARKTETETYILLDQLAASTYLLTKRAN